MLIRPIQTEKAYRKQAERGYMFIVPARANKHSVAAQVASQDNGTVESGRIVLRKGKATKFSRGRHAYPGTTYRQDKKIAFVTLKDGDSIKIFEEVAEENTEDKKSDKGGDK